MNIAILSGKGGTGKTTVSTNLSLALEYNYIDCDVEEPNGFLFLNPNSIKEMEVKVEYPIIDEEKCISCGKCVDICNFNALAKLKNNIMVFEKLCHSCMACSLVCSSSAISYEKRLVGKIQVGKVNNINCERGILNVGEPMAVPVIKKLLSNLEGNNILDCSPGTSCNVVNTIKNVDKAILVTEPSLFGLHDLKMAVKLLKTFNIPFGVIINKQEDFNNIVRNFCEEENISILGAIPYEKDIAVRYSNGEILYDNLKYKNMFDELSQNIKKVLLWN